MVSFLRNPSDSFILPLQPCRWGRIRSSRAKDPNEHAILSLKEGKNQFRIDLKTTSPIVLRYADGISTRQENSCRHEMSTTGSAETSQSVKGTLCLSLTGSGSISAMEVSEVLGRVSVGAASP